MDRRTVAKRTEECRLRNQKKKEKEAYKTGQIKYLRNRVEELEKRLKATNALLDIYRRRI